MQKSFELEVCFDNNWKKGYPVKISVQMQILTKKPQPTKPKPKSLSWLKLVMVRGWLLWFSVFDWT